MKRKHLFIFCLGLGFFFSCSRYQKDENKQVFRYNESAGVATLDPAFAKDQSIIWACSQLYNGLIQLDDHLQISPSIAKEYSLSADARTYRFVLRDDVYFHDHQLFKGVKRKVTASDFVYSFMRIMDEKVASPGAWIFNHVDSLNSKPALWVENDSVFCIRLKNAFPPFLSLLGMPYCVAVPHEVVAYYGKEFRKNPVGTGPFQLAYWKEGVKLVLTKNPDYFEKDSQGVSLPYLDAVAITFLVDKQTAFLEFIKGNSDLLNSIDPSYKDEVLTVTGQLKEKYKESLTLFSEPYLNTEYLGFLMDFNQKDHPLYNKQVRQAINWGFDRKKMIRFLRNNIGTPGCYGIIPPGMPSFDTLQMKGYGYDPEKARQLLEMAGYPGGQGMEELTLSTTQTYVDLCRYLQQQLGLLGIKVKVDVNPPGALREQIAQAKIQWFRGSWIADYPDAENYLSLFYSKNFTPSGPNYTHFKSAEFDRLYEQSWTEKEDSVRYGLYRQMDRILIEEAPFVILYYDQVIRFTHKNIRNLSTNPMNSLHLKYVQKGD